jgi:hypothetical protein
MEKHYRSEQMNKNFIFLALLSVFPLFASGCGILLGNQRPVAERSETYQVADLTKNNPKWVRIEGAGHGDMDAEEAEDKADLSDIAYRSTETESVIALNSACRPSYALKDKDLHLFTNQLLMGFSSISSRTEEPVTLSGTPALETTLEGSYSGQKVKTRVVVLKKGTCLYDLMYLSQPQSFPSQEEEFKTFVASLHLK